MMRRASIVFAIAVLLGVLLAGLAVDYTERESLRPLAESYVKLAPQQLATPNVITGDLADLPRLRHARGGGRPVHGGGRRWSRAWRGGRSARRHATPEPEPVTHRRANSCRPAPQILFPLIIDLCGLHHHERPHVGWRRFSGRRGDCLRRHAAPAGAARVSAERRLSQHRPNRWRAFCSYWSAIAGLIFAGGFLDNRVLPLGQFGAFFSAGAIPVLSVLLGIKVGCELSVIVDRFRG